jgi:hypothetical protein
MWFTKERDDLMQITYCTESRTCGNISPRTALPQRSTQSSGSSHTYFLLLKAFCGVSGELVPYIEMGGMRFLLLGHTLNGRSALHINKQVCFYSSWHPLDGRRPTVGEMHEAVYTMGGFSRPCDLKQKKYNQLWTITRVLVMSSRTLQMRE